MCLPWRAASGGRWGVQLPAPGPQAQAAKRALTHGLRRSRLRVMVVSSSVMVLSFAKQKLPPTFGARVQALAPAHAVPPDLVEWSSCRVVKWSTDHKTHRPQDYLTISCGCNGPSRLPYCAGRPQGVAPTAVRGHARGWFSSRFGWPGSQSTAPASLKPEGARLLVPVNALAISDFGFQIADGKAHRRSISNPESEISNSPVGGIGLEPTTFAMSTRCSNQLS